MKAQLSLEYATTYSWALVIMLVIVGSLVYYGVLESDKHIEPECKIGAQFPCADFYLSRDGEIGIKFVNTINDNLIIEEFATTEYLSDCTFTEGEIKPGNYGIIVCNIIDTVYGGDYENLLTEMNFSLNKTLNDNGERTKFTVKGKILITVEQNIVNREPICDADQDNERTSLFGCGGSDCNDNDASVQGPRCYTQANCQTGETCINQGTCTSECIVDTAQCTTDADGDGVISSACGGIDQCDLYPTIIRPRCYLDSDCNTRTTLGYCNNKGSCSSECTTGPDRT